MISSILNLSASHVIYCGNRLGFTDFMDDDLSQNEGLSNKTGYSNLQITDMEKTPLHLKWYIHLV